MTAGSTPGVPLFAMITRDVRRSELFGSGEAVEEPRDSRNST
jgi:hypothetical protein